MASHYDKDVVLKRLRERRRRRKGTGRGDRFLNLFLWIFVFLAAGLVLFAATWFAI